MNRFDGTAARQLLLVGDDASPVSWREAPRRRQVSLRLLQKDIYVELAKRRRRAQIAARHLVDAVDRD
jgi:hypothetical protein